jgi:hypothetical protein
MATLKNTTINDTGFIKLPYSGTRPGSPTAAQIRYNTGSGLYEGYATGGWHILSPINHTVTGVTPVSGFIDSTSSTKQINPSSSAVFQINGFNFTTGSTVKFDSTSIGSATVTFTSPEVLTVTTGTGNLTTGTYSNIVVTNEYGQSSTFAYPIQVVGGPVFSTATSLGTVTEGTISTSVAAASPSGTVTYSSNAVAGGGGSGYGLPSGLSINSSTGAITGSITLTGTSTAVYNLTIKATDNSSRTASKDFTLTVTNASSPAITSPSAGSLGTLDYIVPITTGSTTLTTNSNYTNIATISASNPSSVTLSYVVTSGSLPKGITLNSSSGVIAGSFNIGARQAASQTFNFGITAKDSLGNSSAENQYSLTVTTPYYFRQILTTGYSIGGYKSGAVWRNVNRLIMASEITVDLGDVLPSSHNYHSGACGPDHQYTTGCTTGGGANIVGTKTQKLNMRTETCANSNDHAYSGGQMATWAGNDGYQTAIYTAGGSTGTNSDKIQKMPIATDTWANISATLANTTQYGNAITGSTELYAAMSGSTGAWDGATAITQKFVYSTDTMASWTAAGAMCGSPQDKVLSSKLDRMYGGTASGTPGSTTWTKTIWSTDAQYTINKPINSAEQNYIMGQDRGWYVGMYNAGGGGQINASMRLIYAVDIASAANTGTERKGVTGSSSGTCGWRD